MLGSISLADTLDDFREFMVLNPHEIVTVFWEFGYNMRAFPTTEEQIMLRAQLHRAVQKAQLLPHLYVQRNASHDWPTLHTMISHGTRLVFFTDRVFGNLSAWDNDQWRHTSQTTFEASDIEELAKKCSLWDPSVKLAVVNHFTVLGALGVNAASTDFLAKFLRIKFFANVNRNPFFAKRVVSCAQDISRFPSFIAVDFWESSDVLQVVNLLNCNFYSGNASWDTANANRTAKILDLA